MKILLIENRYTTYLWDAVAKELMRKGHQIFWIVQNKEFTPETGEKFFIKIPKKKKYDEPKVYDDDLKKVLRSHRGINHFMVNTDDHVFYAKRQINEFIDRILPDVAFGECTLHHELLAMQSLRKKKIPYFFPASCRFPIQRFSFYWYDSLIPFSGSGQKMAFDEAVGMAKEIAERKLRPLYLKNQLDKPPSFVAKVQNRLKLIKSYFYSDPYNTPSIWTKLMLKRKSRNFRKRWDKMASKEVIPNGHFKILYPLQMQPEATIDTWATEFNNQAEIIKNILENTAEDVMVVVKPNPSSSLEINTELIHLAKTNPRVLPLKHSVKMEGAVTKVDMAITTTGTIGIECIFANKPIITLVKSYFNQARTCRYLDNYSQLPEIVLSIKDGSYPVLSESEKASYLNYLNSISYQGNISCTFIQRSALNSKNIGNLLVAFSNVIEQIKQKTTKATVELQQ